MSLTAKQRLTCQQTMSKMSELEKKLSKMHDTLLVRLADVEARFKKCRKIKCAASNMRNGIIPFDMEQLTYDPLKSEAM